MANSRPFLDFLREHRNGVMHDELSDKLQECVASVAEEGAAATLTIKITIKPANAGEGALMVTDELKTVLPKPRVGGSIFFASPDNNLIREDPKQHRLPLAEVGPARTPRAIGDA
jgi:hypothetical protein